MLMNKYRIGIVFLLFVIPSLVLGAFKMRNLRIEPEFIQPGEEVTVFVEAVHDFSVFTNMAGVFSLNNAVWDTSDYLFLYNAGEGLVALNPPMPNIFAHRYMVPDQTFVGWFEYSWKTIVPTTFTQGQMLTIIVRGTQVNMPMVTLMKPEVELSITVEVTSGKGVCYNTAYMKEKSATDKLVIIDKSPLAELTASPPYPGSGSTYIYTTPSLDVELKTNADSIYYTVDGSDPGISATAVGVDTVGIVIISGDTVTLRGLAKGNSFTSIKKTWTYIRKLPKLLVIADPASSDFFTSVSVKLSLQEPVPGAVIYYTLDGSTPDTASNTTFVYNNVPIIISKTTTLKTKAFADNIKPSIVTTEIYTLVLGIVSAKYRDDDGDGAIDQAILNISKETEALPQEIVFNNPFVSTDSVIVKSSSIAWHNNQASTKKIIASLSPPFPYTDSTGFVAKELGRITSGDYTKEAFVIGDSVAPVINQATYCPGIIIDKNTKALAPDTLSIIFSEKISNPGKGVIKPFSLITKTGIEYYFDLTTYSAPINRATFLVEQDGINGVVFPKSGDSIWIDANFGMSDQGHIVQSVTLNRHVPLFVKSKPMSIAINILHPCIPVKKNITIPDLNNISDAGLNKVVQQNGLTIIVDILTDIIGAGHTVVASAGIFDPTGNRIGFGSNKKLNNGNINLGIRDNNGITQVIIYWSGHNLNKRVVGGSSYQAIINISLSNGNETYFEEKFYRIIGIKKE